MKVPQIVFSVLWILSLFNPQHLSGQDTIKVEGRLMWNLTDFQGFYDLEESEVQILKDTLVKLRTLLKDSVEAQTFFKEYDLIEKHGLLYTPCKFIITANGEKQRVFFNDFENKKINESDWFNKNKKNKLHTYITLFGQEIFKNTFICHELLAIEQKQFSY